MLLAFLLVVTTVSGQDTGVRVETHETTLTVTGHVERESYFYAAYCNMYSPEDVFDQDNCMLNLPLGTQLSSKITEYYEQGVPVSAFAVEASSQVELDLVDGVGLDMSNKYMMTWEFVFDNGGYQGGIHTIHPYLPPTESPTPPPTYAISGIAFNDENCDGELDDGESVAVGSRVKLIENDECDASDNMLGLEIDEQETNGSGEYEFLDVSPGCYKIYVESVVHTILVRVEDANFRNQNVGICGGEPGGCQECSRLSCEDLSEDITLKWSRFEENRICAATIRCGADDCSPSQRKTHSESIETCTKEHMRLCTKDELSADVTKGTGCGLDDQLIWSSTPCVVPSSDVHGFYAAAGEQADWGDDPSVRCLPPQSVLNTRCCADESFDNLDCCDENWCASTTDNLQCGHLSVCYCHLLCPGWGWESGTCAVGSETTSDELNNCPRICNGNDPNVDLLEVNNPNISVGLLGVLAGGCVFVFFRRGYLLKRQKS